jgi:hypothetical protein
MKALAAALAALVQRILDMLLNRPIGQQRKSGKTRPRRVSLLKVAVVLGVLAGLCYLGRSYLWPWQVADKAPLTPDKAPLTPDKSPLAPDKTPRQEDNAMELLGYPTPRLWEEARRSLGE